MVPLHDLAEHLRNERAGRPGFVIGITGGVAAGKSTLAAALMADLAAGVDAPRVETACTDGFLMSNATLARAGLTDRKGYPESYDSTALHAALLNVRRGPARFPVYSHLVYDIDPGGVRTLDRPDVLIIEGLGLWAAPPVDTLVYVDASEADLETWFIKRFMDLCVAGATDAASFYARFAHLDAAAAEGIGRWVWAEINLPNIRANVLPLRETADYVIRKGHDHRIDEIIVQR